MERRSRDGTYLFELLETSLLLPENHELASPTRRSSSESSLNTLPFLPDNLYSNEARALHANPNSNALFGHSSSISFLDDGLRGLSLTTPPLRFHSSSSSSSRASGDYARIPVLRNNSLIGSSSSRGTSFTAIPDHHYETNAWLHRLRVQSAAIAHNLGDLGLQGFSTGIENYPCNNNGGWREFVPLTNFVNTGTTWSQSAYGIAGGYQAPANSNGNRFWPENSFHTSRRSRLPIGLEYWRGRMNWLAKNRLGSLYLVEKLGEGKEEEIEMIFLELKDRVRELIMVDSFGKSVVLKLFQVCRPEQITHMLIVAFSDEGQLFEICKDPHGYALTNTYIFMHL